MDRQFSEVAKMTKMMSEQEDGAHTSADFEKTSAKVSANQRQLARVSMWISELDQLEAGSMKATLDD